MQVTKVAEADYKAQFSTEFSLCVVMALAIVMQYVGTAYFVTMKTRLQIFNREFMA